MSSMLYINVMRDIRKEVWNHLISDLFESVLIVETHQSQFKKNAIMDTV